MATDAIAVSAPGKVLLAGGYLVLDPEYPGVVVATQARFYSIARPASPGQTAAVLVRSPQFVNAQWTYNIRLSAPQAGSGYQVNLVQTGSSFQTAGPNPFVALALLTAHRLALDTLGYETYRARIQQKVELTIVGDNDFYSHRLAAPKDSSTPPPAPSAAELAQLPPFAPLGVPIREVHKTGLGSSAAMTTSIVGALLVSLGLVADSGQLTASDRALVHNTAQLAHCSAQGKIGSGFDVSSATWGSQLFRRFSPEVLAPVLLDKSAVVPEGSAVQDGIKQFPAGLLRETLSARNRGWIPPSSASGKGSSTAVEGLAELGVTLQETAMASSNSDGAAYQPALIQLPPRIQLILADVDAGSNTPSLVSRVMAWRKAAPEWAAQMYRVLNASNQGLADTILALTLESLKDPDRYDRGLDLIAATKSSEWDIMDRTLSDKAHPSNELAEIVSLLISLRNGLRSLRAGMRELGKKAGAPIEPDEMGNLILRTVDAVPGIIGGAVPGAGGYDALYLLYIAPKGPDVTREAIHKFWAGWKGDDGLSVGPLLTGADGADVKTVLAEADSKGEAYAHKQLHPGLPNSALFLQPALAHGASCAGLTLKKVSDVAGLARVLP